MLVLLTIGVGSAFADQDITSSGPINNIWVTSDLGCQATQVGDTTGEFYGGALPGACGTFLAVPSFGLYGPSVPGNTALVGSDFSPQSQSPVTGDGSAANPYTVVSTVTAGSTGMSITQTDSYVVGQPYYRSVIIVTNNNSSPVPGVNLYHVGDCNLQGSDSGYGWYDPTGQGIYCTANPNNSPAAGVVGFEPLAGNTTFAEGYYASVWGQMNPFGPQFSDTCDCSTYEDNGAGLSWLINFPPISSFTASLLTFISPSGTPTTSTPTTPTGPTSSPGQPNSPASGPAGQPGQPSGTPVLGQSFNAVPVSGQVLVKLPGSGFAPLTQTRLLPTGTQVDTLSGKVELVSATGNKKGNTTQNGTFNGSIFTVNQAGSGHNKGLVTLKLLDASCKASKAAAGPLAQAASGAVLSTVHAGSHGKYSTSGHYGSATSRGTAWTLTDRCKSTLITVQKDKVLVHDFVHHRTLTLHAGQRDLITAKR